ncbi:MAG: nuclear transport factor 2 family protein [Opitutus sp.]
MHSLLINRRRRWAISLLAVISHFSVLSAAEKWVAERAPAPAVNEAIEANEAAFLKAVLAQDSATLESMLSDDFVYVHENGGISIKKQFLQDYLAQGYVHAERVLRDPTRQYGKTVFTVSTGHLQLKSEKPYPPTSVTHIWVEQGGRWLLVHRQESHGGDPIGKQLPPEGGPNPTHELGSKPGGVPGLIINEHEAAWAYAMITTDVVRMDKLVDESLQYLHVIPLMSNKDRFMWELKTGFTETFFQDMTMRQFGDMIIVLHRARYRHTGKPEQSPGIAMHAWYQKDGEWVMVGRHGTRFAAY